MCTWGEASKVIGGLRLEVWIRDFDHIQRAIILEVIPRNLVFDAANAQRDNRRHPWMAMREEIDA
jgi:hypothetical protein